jgi:predicted tellurium resistance membrane protein TerC
MLDLLTLPETWISLATLSAMEIVLGIDNVVFLTILTGRLPPGQQPGARRLGLGLALVSRIGLLLAISWVMGLTAPLGTVGGHPVSGRDLILLAGGLFLIGKSTIEIHGRLEPDGRSRTPGGGTSYGLVLLQVAVLDLVFSLDSVVTAVGMARHLPVMVAAMLVAMGVMMAFAEAVGGYVERHPTMKMLALAFLMLIGVMLVAEGLGRPIEKGYIYFAMAFSLLVELLNLGRRKRLKA